MGEKEKLIKELEEKKEANMAKMAILAAELKAIENQVRRIHGGADLSGYIELAHKYLTGNTREFIRDKVAGDLHIQPGTEGHRTLTLRIYSQINFWVKAKKVVKKGNQYRLRKGFIYPSLTRPKTAKNRQKSPAVKTSIK